MTSPYKATYKYYYDPESNIESNLPKNPKNYKNEIAKYNIRMIRDREERERINATAYKNFQGNSNIFGSVIGNYKESFNKKTNYSNVNKKVNFEDEKSNRDNKSKSKSTSKNKEIIVSDIKYENKENRTENSKHRDNSSAVSVSTKDKLISPVSKNIMIKEGNMDVSKGEDKNQEYSLLKEVINDIGFVQTNNLKSGEHTHKIKEGNWNPGNINDFSNLKLEINDNQNDMLGPNLFNILNEKKSEL